ncbi:MAG: hypothetical protein ABJO01_02195 [Parasphingorhabdus sp.]|uniref:hypothetical protein n=1 Tax=Parasphingorhabdus sp. TaxID=2709688 RepID=UPI003297379F
MNSAKTRNFLVLVHLYLAAFLAPSFLLVGATGALYLLDADKPVQETSIELPKDVVLDPQSPSIKADVEKVLRESGVALEFEYIRSRGDSFMTRPTSRTYAQFEKTENGWTATLNEPGLLYSLTEMHKGHGPTAFRYFQIFAGISLFLVVFGGLIVGLLSKAYRGKTIMAALVGTGIFLVVGFVA